MTVAEVTGSNVVSVAEHVVMQILCLGEISTIYHHLIIFTIYHHLIMLVRNFVPSYKQVVDGEWDIAGIANKAWDLENMAVGTVGSG